MYVVVELSSGEVLSYPDGSMFEMIGGMACVRDTYSDHCYAIHTDWLSAKIVNRKKKEVLNAEED